MTNKEKNEYLSLMTLSRSQSFPNEIARRNQLSAKSPNTLYKYRTFDKYTFDMLDNDYVFLAPAGTLDDPFDCMVSTSFDGVYENGTYNITNQLMTRMLDIIFKYSGAVRHSKEDLIKLIDKCTENGKIVRDTLEKEMDKMSNLTNAQKFIMGNALSNFDNTLNELINEGNELKETLKIFIQSKEKIGVCSFSTKRDNKVMWSHYSDIYKGYCIEYGIPKSETAESSLLPVVYSKKATNNISISIIDFLLENLIRNICNGTKITDLGAFNKLICTKDSDWSYQDEWRILGDAKQKLKGLKIKNIYLGFDVLLENKNQMIECARRNHFGLYEMKKPNGEKKISYTKII